jgi:hypothetical protein
VVLEHALTSPCVRPFQITREILKKEQGSAIDDETRHKIKNFVKGYMKKIGPGGYVRSSTDKSPA